MFFGGGPLFFSLLFKEIFYKNFLQKWLFSPVFNEKGKKNLNRAQKSKKSWKKKKKIFNSPVFPLFFFHPSKMLKTKPRPPPPNKEKKKKKKNPSPN